MLKLSKIICAGGYACVVVSLLAVLLVACRKQDEVPPRVAWSSPAGSSAYAYPSAIAVKAHVSDDRSIARISLLVFHQASSYPLVNSDIPVPDATEFHLDETVIFDDLYAPSGEYTVQLRVSDGDNETISSRSIALYEAPRVLTAVLAGSSDGSAGFRIDSLQGNAFVSAYEDNWHYRMGALNSRHQVLFIAGKDYEGVKTLRLADFETAAQVSVPNDAGDEQFTCSAFDPVRQTALFGSLDGAVLGFNSLGQLSASYSISTGYVPVSIAAGQERIAVLASGLNQSRVELFNAINGVKLQSLLLSATEVHYLIAHPNGQDFWVFAQDGEDAVGMRYDPVAGLVTPLPAPVVSGGTITQVAGDSGGIFIADSDNELLRLDPQDLSTEISTSAALPCTALSYDAVNQDLWVLTPGTIYRYDALSLSEEALFTPPAGCQSLWLVYNK